MTIQEEHDETTTVTAGPSAAGGTATVADVVRPLLAQLIGEVPVAVEFWDGSRVGPDNAAGALQVRSPAAIRRILWAPGELGVGRAFVAGDLDYTGDLFGLIAALRPAGVELRRPVRAVSEAVRAAQRLGVIGGPVPPPLPEARPHWRRHTRSRDAEVISHHYDVGNAFYRLVLGETMTYSCARFVSPDDSLETAQAAKHELVCRKLDLHRATGMRLLDVGCGWGSMAIHAAQHHGAQVVGITISREQAEAARRRVREAGVDDLVDIRLQDYRELRGEEFDAVSSIGMFEHVGKSRIGDYFSILRALLVPHGRLLNHAISSRGGSRLGGRSFTYRYVFPDGELIDVGDVAVAMQAAGFELRDVESLREHYALTLRQWVGNLEAHWDEAVGLVGAARARVWLLYMAASAIGFEDGGISIHQTLGVVPDADGGTGMPATRREWDPPLG